MKKSIAVLVCLCLTVIVKAQDYYHGLGGQFNYGIYNIAYSGGGVDYEGVNVASVPGIFYKSTLSFKDADNGPGFCVSAYPFLGLSLSINSQAGGQGSFGAELPVLGEVYFGELDDACFYVGAGWTFAYMSTLGFASGSIVGPQFDIGGQFPFRGSTVGLRLAYTKGVNKAKFDNTSIVTTLDKRSMIGVGVYYPLGQ